MNCPYEDKSLAFWIKVVFEFIWAISIPNGMLVKEEFVPYGKRYQLSTVYGVFLGFLWLAVEFLRSVLDSLEKV